MKIKNKHSLLFSLVLATGLIFSTQAGADPGAKITSTLKSVEVVHNGKQVEITRTDDDSAVIPKAFSKIGRGCPPFCIQPMQIAPGVETVGELELLGYLKRSVDDRTVMVVDSRTPEWISRGTIPGSVNIPWNKINVDIQGSFEIESEAETLHDILVDQLGVRIINGQRDFRNVKTLVLFCNGNWCPQSGMNIKTLIRMGYPAYKLKWYRGGMQSWVSLGLTTVTN
jgi:rhodanese-related sulfurtransferase